LPNRAVDEAYLANPSPSVNNNLKEFFSFFEVSFKVSAVETKKERSQKQHCFCVVFARGVKNDPVTFVMSARGTIERLNCFRVGGSCRKPKRSA
jgi:hypothetical protein